MKDLFYSCDECDGWGFVTIDLNDTIIPYEQNPIDYECMACSGKGKVLHKDEYQIKLDGITEMIEGMETRIEGLSRIVMKAKNPVLYIERLKTLSCGLYRLKNYKQKLLNLAM
jgi:hypothetical protein